MGFGKHGLLLATISIIGLVMIIYLTKSQGIVLPYIEYISGGLLVLFLIGLGSTVHGIKAHLRKNGHISR